MVFLDYQLIDDDSPDWPMKRKTSQFTRMRLRLALLACISWWQHWREPARLRGVKHQLAVCAIFQEKAPFLDEWLTFPAA